MAKDKKQPCSFAITLTSKVIMSGRIVMSSIKYSVSSIFCASIHYLRRPLCRGPRALGKGPKALGKGFAERCPRQRALGKKINGKEALCRGPFVGHSAKPFPRANGDTRQRKAAVNGAVPLTTPLPSADSYGTRQRYFLFFFSKTLCRVPRRRALGKTIF